MQKLNALTALSLSAILIFSMISVSSAQFDEEEIVKVRVKQGKSMVMVLVKNSEDFGLDIYGFSIKLTNGNVKGFKAPKMWTGERDAADPNTINFSTEDKPILAGKGGGFRLRVDTQSPAFDWTALDEDGEEIDSGTAAGKSRGPTMEKPMPVPVPPVTTGERAAALSVSPERTMPGSAIKIAGKGFAPNSQVAIMLDESELVKAETDSNGYFETEATIPKDIRHGMHKVWARDTAGNFASAPIMVGEHEKPEHEKPKQPDMRAGQLAVKTEREHYSQGETVVIVGHGTSSSTVELQVMDSMGKVVFHEKASTDNNGMFGVKMSLGSDAPSGMYIVYARQEVHEAKWMFKVMSREKPMPMPTERGLTVHTERDRYHDGDNVVIYGRAGSGTVGIAVMYGEATDVASSVVFKGEATVSMEGSYKIMFTLKNVREGAYMVMAQQGDMNAHTKFFVGSGEKGEYPGEKGEHPSDSYKHSKLRVDTDKDSYRAGEAVTIFGEGADPNKRIEIFIFYLEKDHERELYKDVLTPNPDGSFKKTSPAITSDVPAGIYTVLVMQDGLSAKTQFKIET
jgi:hypothetical protein